MNWIDKDLILGKVLVKEADWNAMSLRVSELTQYNVDLVKRIRDLEAALEKIANMGFSPVSAHIHTALEAIRGSAKETPRQAHSKSEYKRLTALGVECTP